MPPPCEVGLQSGHSLKCCWSHRVCDQLSRRIYAVDAAIYQGNTFGKHILIKKTLGTLFTYSIDLCSHLTFLGRLLYVMFNVAESMRLSWLDTCRVLIMAEINDMSIIPILNSRCFGIKEIIILPFWVYPKRCISLLLNIYKDFLNTSREIYAPWCFVRYGRQPSLEVTRLV